MTEPHCTRSFQAHAWPPRVQSMRLLKGKLHLKAIQAASMMQYIEITDMHIYYKKSNSRNCLISKNIVSNNLLYKPYSKQYLIQ